MPEHTNHVGPLGPLIAVGIAVGAPFAMIGLGGPPRTCTALIDTGTSITAVSPSVQNALRAQVIGRRAVERPESGNALRALLDIRLKFEGHLASHPWFDLSAVETESATPGVDILIGHDLLRQIRFTWDGPGERFVLSY